MLTFGKNCANDTKLDLPDDAWHSEDIFAALSGKFFAQNDFVHHKNNICPEFYNILRVSE